MVIYVLYLYFTISSSDYDATHEWAFKSYKACAKEQTEQENLLQGVLIKSACKKLTFSKVVP